jgi:hypothetical protein
MNRIWIVTTPRKSSVLEDICFETTAEGLELQFKGGLTAREIVGFFSIEKDAREVAADLIRSRDREAAREAKDREEMVRARRLALLLQTAEDPETWIAFAKRAITKLEQVSSLIHDGAITLPGSKFHREIMEIVDGAARAAGPGASPAKVYPSRETILAYFEEQLGPHLDPSLRNCTDEELRAAWDNEGPDCESSTWGSA